MKSADAHNDPRPIKEMTTKELAILPKNHVMLLQPGMRDIVAQDMTGEQEKILRRCASNALGGFTTPNLKSMSMNWGVQASKGA